MRQCWLLLLLLVVSLAPPVAAEDYYAPPFGVWLAMEDATWQAITTAAIPLTGPDCTYVGIGLGPFMPLPLCAAPVAQGVTIQYASPHPGGATATYYAFEPAEGYVIVKICDPMMDRVFPHQVRLVARVACGD